MKFKGKIVIEDSKIRILEHHSSGLQLTINNQTFELPKGAAAYPGFVDSHGHVEMLGENIRGLNFNNAQSADEVCAIAKKSGQNRGDWIYGRGWNQELWYDNRMPNLEVINDYFPNAPVLFIRIDGHSAWCNSTAIKLAGLQSKSDPIGGEIVRDSCGNPTGLLIDSAINLVSNCIPTKSSEDIRANIKSGINSLSSFGITEVHDMDVYPEIANTFIEMAYNSELNIDVVAYLQAQNDEYKKIAKSPKRINKLNMAGLKYFSDGALGSRSAAMIEPYSDASNTNGLLILNRDDCYGIAQSGTSLGWQIAIHAIGDRANREVLSAFQRLIENISDLPPLRIEHSQIVHPNDLQLYQSGKIFPMIQPIHCLSDASNMAEDRLGFRCKYAYPWKSLIDNGALINSSSDFPIESHDPLIGIYALIKRIPFNKNESWYPDECISLNEALSSYMFNSSLLSGNIRYPEGLKIDMKADIAILTNEINEENLKNGGTEVLMTIADGKIIYEKPIL